MNDSLTPYFQNAAGPVHAGSGKQSNNFFLSSAGVDGRSPRKQAEDDLLWLYERFVRPERFGDALEVLKTHRTVFIEAPPGSGRTATAKMLLWEGRTGSEDIHELPLQEKDSRLRLDLDHIADGDRVWLDMSTSTEQHWRQIRDEIAPLRATVRQHAAHLAIVLPDAKYRLLPEHDRYRVRIEPPRQRSVLLHHLRAEGLFRPGLGQELPSSRLLETRRKLEEISGFVSLVREARDRAAGEGDFTSWWSIAEKAFLDLPGDVAEQVRRLRDGTQRALLLTVGMLHGAHVGGVHRASSFLLETVGHPPGEGTPLDGATLDERLKEIGAQIDASSHTVQFHDFNYDAAVRTYFWAKVPGLHEHMPAWLEKIADSSEVSAEEWRRLIVRFGDQCLGDRHDGLMRELIERWADRSGNRREAAMLLLWRGLRHERHGRAFRKQIYEWAHKKELPRGLAELIIIACRDVVAVRHPDEALVRLHHMARRAWGAEARTVLVDMVRENRRSFRQLLARLTFGGPGRKWSADVDLFLEIAAPEVLTVPGPRERALICERGVRRLLVEGWDIAFTDAPPATWDLTARRWLRLAAEDERHRDELLTVLVGGAGRHPDVLAHLHGLPYRLRLPPLIGELLFQKINDAQGVRLT